MSIVFTSILGMKKLKQGKMKIFTLRNAAIANEEDDSWPSSDVLILVVFRIPRGMRNYIKYFLDKVYRSSKGKWTTTWRKKSTSFVFFQYKEMRGFLRKKHFSHKV